ncbi:MAG: hypothetical protein HC818_06035 [Synechococcaceae cyanobacterium RM1_1_27]|nr:hypothetical protein [Synechococcaceae cyanobacterium SM2_3_2]NJO86162.1 hypothetical protein [Synechococcaceae cyanobacterium RM1_1_27]
MATPSVVSQGLGFGWMILLGFLGAWIGLKLKVPAGVLVGSMAFVGLGNILSQSWGTLALPPLPGWVGFGLQLALGITLGTKLSPETFVALKDLWKPVLISTTVAIGTGMVSAYGLSRWLGIEQMTALLSTAPGGISGMSLLALDMGAQSTTVVIMHLARLITVVVLVPLLVKLIVHPPPIG